jgi:hypothetical protein
MELSIDYAVISTSLAFRIAAGFSICAPLSGPERSNFVPRAERALKIGPMNGR